MSSRLNKLRFITWLVISFLYLYLSFRTVPSQYIEFFPDSERYFSPHSILSLENAGIFYSIFVRAVDVFPGIVLAQVLLSCICWLFLSWALLRLFPGWLGLFSAFVTLVVGTQQSVVSWNNLVLSESTAISTTAFWFGTLLLILKPSVRSHVFALKLSFLFIASSMMVVVRPQLALIVIPALVAVAVSQWGRMSRLTQWMSFLGSAFIFLFSFVRLAVVSLGSPFTSAYSQHLIDFRQPFTLYALQKVGCADLFTGLDGQLSKYVSDCPPLQDAISQGNLGFVSWALNQPAEAVSSFFKWISTDAVLPHYSSAVTILAPEHANAVLSINYSVANMLGFFSLGALILVAMRALNKSVTFSIKRFLLVLGFFLCVLVYVFISWGVDGIELARHALPLSLFLPLIASVGILWIFSCEDSSRKRPLFSRRSFSWRS